jgi:hypothetical protein
MLGSLAPAVRDARAACVGIVFVIALAGVSRAADLNDGVLALRVTGNRYAQITLSGGPFNQSTFVQAFYLDDFEASHGPAEQSVTATSVTSSFGWLESSGFLTTEILGPLAGLPGSAILLQTLSLTRDAGAVGPRTHTIHSYWQSRLGDFAGDTGDFDPTTGAVFSVDDDYLFAMRGSSSGGETARWGVAQWGPNLDEFGNLTNGGGPLVGSVLTELGLGFAVTLDPGETVELEFVQLFAQDIASVPPSFALPEPDAAPLGALLGLAWLGIGRRRA